MSNVVFNVSKGRVAGYFDRVKNQDPSGCALVLVPLSAAAADATLIDQATLAAVLAGGSTEQTTMGRKVLTATDLTAATPDNTNDRQDCVLPTVTWAAATGAATVKILVAYRPASGSADSAIVPLTCFDFVVTPGGADVQMTGGVFFRAS